MEINEIFTNIKELGRVNSKRADLREFCKLNIEQVIFCSAFINDNKRQTDSWSSLNMFIFADIEVFAAANFE